MANPFEQTTDQTISFPQSTHPILQSLVPANQAYQEQAAKTDESSDRMMEQIGVLFKKMNEEIRTSRTLAIQWESRYKELEVTSETKIGAERSLVIDEVAGLKKLVTEKLGVSQDVIDALQKEVKSLKEYKVAAEQKISDLEKKVAEQKTKSTNDATTQNQVNNTLSGRITTVDTRVTTVDARVTTVDARVTTVNNRATALHTALCKEIGATQKWIGTLASKITW